MTIDGKITILDSNNKKLHEERRENQLIDKDAEIDMLGTVCSEIAKNLTNDMLIIDLFLSIKKIETKKLNRLMCDKDPERKLREDFKMMLENPVNSDVTLQVGDGQEQIHVHWAILCSRSPYFKKMFDSGMKERVQNSVTITDSSLSTVKKLVQFMYTAGCLQEDNLQELFDLYLAADKYEVMDLRSLCGDRIISNATADNVCEIFQLSRRHFDKALKKRARLHSVALRCCFSDGKLEEV